MTPPTSLGLVACVVDATPVLHEQLLRWFAALHRVAKIPSDELLVVSIDAARTPRLEYLASAGVRITRAPGFDPRSPHCNKLRGLHLLSRLDRGKSVLSDCDVAFVCDPRTVPVPANALGAKQVDGPNPPAEILETILREAGLPAPPRVPLTLVPDTSTLNGNVNGGLYVADGAVFHILATSWERWARWLLDRRHLLGDWAVHVDQVSMLLSLVDSNIPLQPLELGWNCPTHLGYALPVKDVRAVHYHDAVDDHGHLKRTGNVAVDAVTSQIDAAYDEVRREAGAAP